LDNPFLPNYGGIIFCFQLTLNSVKTAFFAEAESLAEAESFGPSAENRQSEAHHMILMATLMRLLPRQRSYFDTYWRIFDTTPEPTV
jgi:hypothetical protein